jgi:hypothetical protein
MAGFCAATSDHFVALAMVALSHPQLAVVRRPQQLAGRLKIQRVLFDGARADAIEFARNCSVERADAGREVRSSAESFGSAS